MKKKIKGLKKAVGEYQWANSQGTYSPWYGCLMFDKNTGELWTDTFYSLGHNEWKEYHDSDVVNLGSMMAEEAPYEYVVSMKAVKEFIFKHFPEFRPAEA